MLKVLIVDDNVDVLEAVRDTLTAEGYETAEATDGQAALDYLRSHEAPGLILLDWNMAPMNGRDFMIETAKDPKLAAIPTVLLTADGRAADKSQQSGTVGFLMKPVDLDELFATVARFCGAPA